MIKLIKDENILEINNDNEKANLLTLDYILKNKILKSPDNNNNWK